MSAVVTTGVRRRPVARFSHDPRHVRVLLREADIAARQLVRQFQLPLHERDDLRQDLLVDLLTRIRSFDPLRGTFGAFVGTIIAHRAARLKKRIRRRLERQCVSIDETIPGGSALTWAEALSDDGGSFAVVGHLSDRFSQIHHRLDIERALGSLRPADLRVCAELLDQTPTEVCRLAQRSRATFYRDLKEIRLKMMMTGVSIMA